MRKSTYKKAHNPVEQFSIDYDMPVSLAKLLVGKTEGETEKNIADMKEYLQAVVAAYGEHQKLVGIALNPRGVA